LSLVDIGDGVADMSSICAFRTIPLHFMSSEVGRWNRDSVQWYIRNKPNYALLISGMPPALP
jgi:hypothetical protein